MILTTIILTNNNSYSRSVQSYSGDKFIQFSPGESYEIPLTTNGEIDYYNTLKNQGFSIITKGLPKVNLSTQILSSTKLVTPESLILDTNSVTSELLTPGDVIDSVLDDALSEVINDNEISDNVGVITESSDERDISKLEAWEYKAILKDLGVDTRVRSTDALLSLVQSNIPSEEYDWRSVIKQ